MGGADFARAALLLKYPGTAKIFVSLGRQGNCTDKQDTSATTESHRYTEEGLMQYRMIQVNKTFFKKSMSVHFNYAQGKVTLVVSPGC